MAKDKLGIVSILGGCVRNPCWVCEECETENSNAFQTCEVCGSEKPVKKLEKPEEAAARLIAEEKIAEPDKEESGDYKSFGKTCSDWINRHPGTCFAAAMALLILLIYLLMQNPACSAGEQSVIADSSLSAGYASTVLPVDGLD